MQVVVDLVLNHITLPIYLTLLSSLISTTGSWDPKLSTALFICISRGFCPYQTPKILLKWVKFYLPASCPKSNSKTKVHIQKKTGSPPPLIPSAELVFQSWYWFGIVWLKITNELLPERFLGESLHSPEPQIWHLQSQDNHKDFHGEVFRSPSEKYCGTLISYSLLQLLPFTPIIPMQSHHLFELLTHR